MYAIRSYYEQMRDPETLENVRSLAEGYFRQPVTIKLVPIEEKKEAPPTLIQERKARESDRKNRLKSDALAHPMVKAALDIFEGEVTDVQPIDTVV